MLVEQKRELGDGHAVPHRDGKLPDERLVARLQHRPFNRDPADGIGTVAHDDGKASPRRSAQAVGHGVDKGVDARTDILEVDDEDIDEIEHLGGRLARFAVEREDRHVAARVFPMRGLDHVVLEV